MSTTINDRFGVDIFFNVVIGFSVSACIMFIFVKDPVPYLEEKTPNSRSPYDQKDQTT